MLKPRIKQSVQAVVIPTEIIWIKTKGTVGSKGMITIATVSNDTIRLRSSVLYRKMTLRTEVSLCVVLLSTALLMIFQITCCELKPQV
jgi:hypothetical protein